MIRKHTIGKDKEDPKGLLSKAGTVQTAAAMAALRSLNQRVDLDNLKAGTILLVPDSPGLDPRDSVSVAGEVLATFQQFVHDSLSDMAGRMTAGNSARSAERSNISTAMANLGSEALKSLGAQVSATNAALLLEQQQADQAAQTLASATSAALDILTKLGTLVE